jgi:hypothetical protein
MIPIMLRSFGRSGSTLMMQVLSTNNNIIFDKEYPYENRHLTYLHRLSKLIAKPRDSSLNWTANSLFNNKLSFLGPNPYENTKVIDKDRLSENILKSLWKDFSNELKDKSSNDFVEGDPLYYAEKVVQNICPDINGIVDAKNLFVFRDPRDEFLSIKSFNSKKGVNGFGWLDNDTDETFAKRMVVSRKRYMQNLINMKNNSRNFVITYENFMSDPFKSTKEIGDWLGLQLSYQKVIDNGSVVAEHKTHDSDEATPRWEKEMSEPVKKIFVDGLKDELLKMGYTL